MSGIGRLATATVMLFALTGPASAQRSNIYTVTDIRVDEQAASEVSAKAAGLLNGQGIGLRTLFERLTQRIDHERLPLITNEMVSRALRDFSVSGEKFGGGRYLATLNVRFRPKEVREILHASGIPYAEVASRPALVLPVLRRGRSVVLWKERNAWFNAWLRRPPTTGLLPIVLPERDLSDIAAINARQAVAGDAARLNKIATKYRAFSVFVAVAKVEVDRNRGSAVLTVDLSYHQPGAEPSRADREFRAERVSGRKALFDWAARETIIDIEEAWKRENLQEIDAEQHIRVFVPVERLADWLTIQRKLRSVPSVKQIDVARLSVREAEASVLFMGSPAQLQRALSLKDLSMVYSPERDGYIVRSIAK